MQWKRSKELPGPTSIWRQRTSQDGRYIARKVISSVGDRTRYYALRCDAQGNPVEMLGNRFLNLRTAMAACERDARASRQAQLA